MIELSMARISRRMRLRDSLTVSSGVGRLPKSHAAAMSSQVGTRLSMLKWLFAGGDDELTPLERAVTSKPGHLVGTTWTAPGPEIRVNVRIIGVTGTLFLEASAGQVSVRHDPAPNATRQFALPEPRHLDGWDDAGKRNTSSSAQAYLVYSLADMFRGAGKEVCGTATVMPLTGVVKDAGDACTLYVRCENVGGSARVDLDHIAAITKAHPAVSFTEVAWSSGTLVLAVSVQGLSPEAQAAFAEKVSAISRKRSREDDADERTVKRFRVLA